MKKVVFFAAVLLLLALAIPAGAAAKWIELSKTGAQCVGASADGERFLMVEVVGNVGVANNSRAYVCDADGGRAAELALVGSAEVDTLADMLLDIAQVPPDRKDATIEELGGTAALALRLQWWHRARLCEASGNFLLVEVAGVYLLVNAETGETVLLTGSAALSPDRRVAMTSAGAISVYDPASGAHAPVEVADAGEWWTMSARLLSDGAFVCARRSVKMTAMNVEFAFAFIGADGKATETVPAGAYRFGGQPDRLFYSEEAGVGIAFSMNRIMSSPPLIFRRGQPSAKVLLLDQPDAARCRAAAIDEVLDEVGALKEEGECTLLPLGISSDGLRTLCIEFKSASLLSIDLNTLEVKTVLTNEDFGALYAEKNAEYRPVMTLSMLGWNSGDILAGPTAPAGCALKLG